jgi:hypothetical protein
MLALLLATSGGLVLARTQVSCAAEAKLDNLNLALVKHAPKVNAFLKEKYGDHQKTPVNVGVLKFMVQKGKAAPSDNVGPLNLTAAQRLESAMIFALKTDDNFGILHRASAAIVEGKNKGANHLTPDGRKKLFDNRNFSLAWGMGVESCNLSADVFVTGLIKLSPDLCWLDVTILAFDSKNFKDEPVAVDTFKAATDMRTLIETGESYLLGKDIKLTPKKQPSDTHIVMAVHESAAKVRKKTEVNPSLQKDAPVELKVYYGDRLMHIKATPDNRAEVPEPSAATKVYFKLHNRSQDGYGAVLLVNGENTLYRETNAPEQCHKWILGPGDEVTIRGFQKDNMTAEEFKVLPVEESKEREIQYGQSSGTFTLVLFRENKEDKDEDYAMTKAERQVAALGQSLLDEKRPESLEALQEAMMTREQASRISNSEKGLIVSGDARGHEVKRVPFRFYPDPVMATTIYYYKPSFARISE